MSTTVVTALYDIGRAAVKGGAYVPFSKYLSWFKNLLSLNVPLVVFVDESLLDYVRSHRPKNYQTEVVTRKFEDLAAYTYHNKMQLAIDKMRQDKSLWKKMGKQFRSAPEYSTAKYQVVTFSKFDLLKEVSEQNPFSSEYFLWLDAGTFQGEPDFDFSLPWPDQYKVKVLRENFLVPNRCFDWFEKISLGVRAYISTKKAEICSYVLGGKKEVISKVHRDFWKKVDNLLEQDLITNEKIILQRLILEDHKKYFLWYPTKFNYFKESRLDCDRKIPYELASGTYMAEDYAVNPDLKMLTVATKEISESKYSRWKVSAKHFGYNYEVLGRDTAWEGFKTKIRLFKERLETVTEPYVALTDSTDIFFCGSSFETLEKFKSLNKDLIVGGEVNCYCPGVKPDFETMAEYFDKIRESEHRYPNSGLIMGKTELVLQLMTLHLGYHDDQTACFETIYNKRAQLDIDYQTKIVANIPSFKAVSSKNRFRFNEKNGRFQNIASLEYPPVMHFPGRYFSLMSEFYCLVFPPDKLSATEVERARHNDTTALMWIVLSLILLLIVILFFFLN